MACWVKWWSIHSSALRGPVLRNCPTFPESIRWTYSRNPSASRLLRRSLICVAARCNIISRSRRNTKIHSQSATIERRHSSKHFLGRKRLPQRRLFEAPQESGRPSRKPEGINSEALIVSQVSQKTSVPIPHPVKTTMFNGPTESRIAPGSDAIRKMQEFN